LIGQLGISDNYDEEVDKNPFDYIKRPKKNNGEAKPFDIETMQFIINGAKDEWFKNFLALSFFTGLRTAEAVALKWSDIDLKNQDMEVKRSRRYGKDVTPKTQKFCNYDVIK